MRKLVYLFIGALCFSSVQGFAQARYEWHQKKYTATLQPLQLLRNTLRLDFEMRIAHGLGWLQFGPALYYYPKETTNNPDYGYIGKYYYGYHYYRNQEAIFPTEPCSGIFGGGLDVNYKWFFDPKRTLYLLGGNSFSRFNVRYWGWEWSDYIQDGLPYHEFVPRCLHQHINRLGINGLFGFMIPSRHAFLVDMFWGFSYRLSFSEKDKPPFGTYMSSPGYTGLVFVTGVRFGVGIK